MTGTASEQARNVVEETRRQARDLMGEARWQAREQAQAGQRKAAENLHALASQLNDMAAKSGGSGMAAQLAEEASNRVHTAASWLDQRQPGDLLDEVRDFARRRPGTFLLGAALAGVLAGRMTRGAVAAARPGQPGESGPPWQASGLAADVPAPAVAPAAETWPAPATETWPVPATDPAQAMPGPGLEPETEYGGGLPGDGYGSQDSGTDAGGDYSYRPGQP